MTNNLSQTFINDKEFVLGTLYRLSKKPLSKRQRKENGGYFRRILPSIYPHRLFLTFILRRFNNNYLSIRIIPVLNLVVFFITF